MRVRFFVLFLATGLLLCGLAGCGGRELHQQLDEMDRAVLSELCLGLSREQLEQLEQITNVMLDNAFRAYGKGSEEESDKNTHKEPAGI